MTREEFRKFALEAFETINSLDEIVDSAKGGLDALRIQLADSLEAADDHDECRGECARQLAGAIRQGNRAILLATDNWLSESRR